MGMRHLLLPVETLMTAINKFLHLGMGRISLEPIGAG